MNPIDDLAYTISSLKNVINNSYIVNSLIIGFCVYN